MGFKPSPSDMGRRDLNCTGKMLATVKVVLNTFTDSLQRTGIRGSQVRETVTLHIPTCLILRETFDEMAEAETGHGV